MDANDKITLSKRISGDQDSDATLVGGVVAHHASRLYQLSTEPNERIRFATIDLIAQLLRQGLLNPMEVVPYLLGMLGDVDNPTIRGVALRLLIAEGEKRPDMLRQRVRAGVKQAYLFQRAVYPRREVTAILRRPIGDSVESECIFGGIFKECIRNIKKQKHGLFKNLLALFDFSNQSVRDRSASSSSSTSSFGQRLPLLSFTAQFLAHLPYASTNDPLYIIHHIQNLAAVEGAQLLDRLCSFLEDQGLPDIDELAPTEDILETAAKAKLPSRTDEASALRDDDFDMERFLGFCEQASPFVILLQLKSFLRDVYNLSEIRCLTHNPENPERSFHHVGSSSPAANHVFTCPLDPIRSVQSDGNTTIDVDEAIRRYAAFRAIMRDEQSANSKEDDDEDDDEAQWEDGKMTDTQAETEPETLLDTQDEIPTQSQSQHRKRKFTDVLHTPIV